MDATATGCPPITRSLAYMTPYQCRTFGCLAVVAWTDGDPCALTVGYCDEHRTHRATVPITVHGHEHDGWERWPMSLVLYLALRERGELR